MNCCDYDCHQGANCPARTTPASMLSPSELRAQRMQADYRQHREDMAADTWAAA